MTSRMERSAMHYDLKNVGLRAHATAAGLVQLCKELKAAGVLEDDAVSRIKDAIADEIALTAPRPIRRAEFRQDICERLNSIFSGEAKLGPAENLAFATDHTD